jgi:hypothetical protein
MTMRIRKRDEETNPDLTPEVGAEAEVVIIGTRAETSDSVQSPLSQIILAVTRMTRDDASMAASGLDATMTSLVEETGMTM